MKIKKMTCPSCGKELIGLDVTTKSRNVFWCDDCNINYEIFDEDDMIMYDDDLLAEWSNPCKLRGDDCCSATPKDYQFLEFDILHNINPPDKEPWWEEVLDACGFTEVTADMSISELMSHLWTIFRAYREVLEDYRQGCSVKKLAGYLRWLGSDI